MSTVASGVVAGVPHAHGQWSGRLAFILAAAGSAVGLGNIWKFPYITGENGGGAFVLVYLGCIVLIGVPLLMTEVMLGRRSGQSPINTFATLAKREGRSRRWGALGWLHTLAAFLILSFYSVIAGWAVAYVPQAMSGAFAGADAAQVGALFDGLLGAPEQLLVWHTVFMLLTVLVAAGGVRAGLERAVKWLMPALLVLLLVMVAYGFTTGGFGAAAAFLFWPDFSKLSTAGVLTALGHAFFTLSLASATMVAYGSYLPKSVSIPRSALIIALMDTVVALLAGLAIFPIVFANGLEAGAGPGLVFQTLPLAFGQMPLGTLIGTLFFILLVFAAWTSSISLLESTVEWLEEKGFGRKAAAVTGGLAAWTVGLASLLSLNLWAGVHPLGMFETFADKTVFDLLDYVTANLMMPLAGLLTAVFAGWVLSRRVSEAELGAGVGYRLWRFLVRFVAPVGVVLIFVYNLG